MSPPAVLVFTCHTLSALGKHGLQLPYNKAEAKEQADTPPACFVTMMLLLLRALSSSLWLQLRFCM